MIYYLKANKTKMVNLLRQLGYHPTISQARFEKMFRRRSYTLVWMEPDGFFEARLLTAGGVSHLRITHDGKSKMLQIPLALLKQLDMAEPSEKPCDQ